MGIPRRESRWSSLLNQSAIYDIGVAICTGFLAVTKLIEDKKAVVFIAVAGVVSLISIGKAVVLFRKNKKDKSTHELEGCLHALHAALGAGKVGRLRITIHVPVKNGQELEQAMEYIGAGTDEVGKSGRRFPAQCGVIGESLRIKKPVAAARTNDDYEQYISELIQEWHYTDHDARQCDPGTYSWLALPLFKDDSNGSVEGIVFVDSTERKFFDDARITISLSICAGIARFVKKRYLT